MKALSPRRLVLCRDNRHSSSSSSKVAIREEVSRVVIKAEASRVVTKVASLKEVEAGLKGVVEDNTEVVILSSITVDLLTIPSRGLLEELLHLSDVVGLHLSILVDPGHPLPSCTKQHKLINSL